RFGANVNFWAIRPPVPPQDRLGCHDSRHVLLDPATESLALGGEASALIIRQPDASRLRVVLENTVLLYQVLGGLLLVAVDHPAKITSSSRRARGRRS